MRRAAKVDANQAEIVEALRAVGASVQVLSQVGGGCPDLMVGWRGKTFAIEVKQLAGKISPRPEPLTPDQIRWHRAWVGHVAVVCTQDDAFAAIGAVVR